MKKPSMIRGWGRLGVPGHEVVPEDLDRVADRAVLSRGLGRSYGDSSLPPEGQTAVRTTRADRILRFDEASGTIRTEAGFPLAELNRLFMPRGFFTPVSPGTKFVTIGGMVASDVHGKNHHKDGCFGSHVQRILLRVSDGRRVECSADEQADLFWATIGGMGLTGHILEVEFTMKRIPSPWIYMESERIPDIDRYIDGLKESGPGWPYTMGWIDCVSRGKNLGRGILMRGRWATPDEAPKRFPPEKRKVRVPFDFPSFALNRLTVSAFNTLYYWKHIPRFKKGVVHPDTFFYPLDALHDWNRLYGRLGFTQYQCVLPEDAGRGAARQFLEILTKHASASPLCVIKDCGAESPAMLSFPKPGISIAVDMPVRKNTQKVVDLLNEFVIDKGGRIYLTKDSFTREADFRAMEPRLDRWKQIRAHWDPELKLRSAQSIRMLGDPS